MELHRRLYEFFREARMEKYVFISNTNKLAKQIMAEDSEKDVLVKDGSHRAKGLVLKLGVNEIIWSF